MFQPLPAKSITCLYLRQVDDCPEHLALDSRNCATEAGVDTVRRIKDIGQFQYHKFVTEVVVDRIASIHEPI